MKKLPPTLQLTAALLLTCSLQAGVFRTLYVSPGGGGDGSSPSQPATIDGAKTYIRNYSPLQTGDIEVILAEGLYFFPEGSPLTLSEADSGKNGHRIVWRNEPGKTVRWSAGFKVQTTWTPSSPGSRVHYSAWVPTWNFRQLYVNGRAEHFCATPPVLNDGRVNWNTTDPADKYIEISKTSLPGPLPTPWPAHHPTEIKLYARWTTQTARIVSLEDRGDKVRIRVANPSFFLKDGKYDDANADKYTYRFQRSAFFAGGGFYQRMPEPLWYKVPTDIDIATAEVIAPRNDQVLIVNGSAETSRARNIVFHGITFEHSNFANPSTDDGFAGFQAARYRKVNTALMSLPGAVELSNTENVDFENCTFRNLGATGVSLNRNVRGTRIVGNTFTEIAAAAVALAPLDSSVGVVRCFVSDNVISRCGTAYEEACGIWMRFGSFNTISYNQVSNTPYTGISLGWGWGQQPSNPPIQGNWCTFNHVFDVMKTLRDGAGIYTLDDHARDTAEKGWIFENDIHHITLNPSYGPGYYAIGLYCDQGSKNILAEHNRIENISEDKRIFLTPHFPAAVVELVDNNVNIANVSTFAGPRSLPGGYQAEKNIALFARAKASSRFSYTHHADKATDVRANTLWASAGDDAAPWFRLDFQRSQRVKRIEIQARADLNQDVARRNFKVYGCTGEDGSGNKVLLHTQTTSAGFPHQGTLILNLAVPQEFRSLSLEKTDGGHFNFSECRVYSEN